MLFREPSLTSLRRDSTRIQNGRFVTGSPPHLLLTFLPPSLSFSLSSPPGTLIYAWRYLCQWIYIPIFIIRNIIARPFIALVEMPSPRRLQPSSLPPPPSFCSFLFLPARDPFAGCHARCDLLDLISVVILKRIFIEHQTRIEGMGCTKLDISREYLLYRN